MDLFLQQEKLLNDSVEFEKNLLKEKQASMIRLLYWFFGGLIPVIYVIRFLFKQERHPAIIKIKNFLKGLTEGILSLKKMPKKEARAVAIEKLKAVGLSEKVADLSPSELSGGMQKRASLARAIAANPDIIFFDEPTTGLDPIMADVINDLIIKNSKELGATTITITHDMHSARKIADKVAMLYEGKIIWFGDVKDLDASGNPFVDQFIHGRAEGPINFLAK